MPLFAFLLISAVVLGISIVGMFNHPSVPMLGEDIEYDYDALNKSPDVIGRIPERPVARRA